MRDQRQINPLREGVDQSLPLPSREKHLPEAHEPLLRSFAGLKGKTGILGASVDPIHHGHIAGALAAARELELDRVVFIPTYQNPLKEREPGASAAQRLQMVRNSLVPYPELFVSDIELLKGETPYTCDTLAEIHAQLDEDAEIYFIGGSDNLKSLHKWKQIADVLEMAEFVTLSRNGISLEAAFEGVVATGDLTEKHISALKKNFLHVYLPEISSTEIRANIAAGDLEGLRIPKAAEEIIMEQGIYKSS